MSDKPKDVETGSTKHFEKESFSEDAERRHSEFLESVDVNTNAKLRNPLSGFTKEQLLDDVEIFAREKGLMDDIDILKKGALVAQNPSAFEELEELNEEEKGYIRDETEHRWRQPWMMYFMTILCAGSAIVQGMDQTTVNGAQVFYFREFNITDVWIQGLVNGAPYLCSVCIGCWTSAPCNKAFGRRGTIFIGCVVSVISSFWQAVTNSWWHLFLARFLMGFAIGAKSSTTPVYGAECSPAIIRGALVMMWQMWTAFGIMLGFIASVAFYNVQPPAGANYQFLNWRLMLGSAGLPPLFVAAEIFLVPESPRWYMSKGKYDKAFDALKRFRNSHLQAARDVYYTHKLLEIEYRLKEGKSLVKEFFVRPRNRRAAQSSFLVMFSQQFCGVNVIAYYSSQIFLDGGFGDQQALLASLGTGIINWLFALPAVYTIDTFGRRNLLLTTYPLMGLSLFFAGFSFLITDQTARTGCVATGIYLFMMVYSPGAGPVPFTYSAEAFPLYIRDTGMSFATATTWGFNFILALTWPALVDAFTSTGAFCWYAGWNMVLFVIAYFCLPETKALTLEELDQVFSVPTTKHAKFYASMIPWYWGKYIMRKNMGPRRMLYELEQ
ncbi:putative MFS myo-inositol transporter [Aulographum hederae CBS 113979]|uniref:Putative MFS myo-inositol transporter n=1 Tax=Aulographum hederae CBS 113979 TaxID=1176131 RepID=A0A6G1HC11_9PEZI|nr:putative MFS myo-inositol transporter [Aulographum hederae CBS 113979]